MSNELEKMSPEELTAYMLALAEGLARMAAAGEKAADSLAAAGRKHTSEDRIDPGKAPGGIVFRRWAGERFLGESALGGDSDLNEVAADARRSADADYAATSIGEIVAVYAYDGDSGRLLGVTRRER